MDSVNYTITLVSIIILSLVGLVIIVGAIYGIAIWYPRQVNKRVAELKASGRQGEAIIVRLPRSDMRPALGSNSIYTLVQIGLEIRVSGFESYEIDKTFTVPTSFLRLLRIGKTVPVWIDPHNPRNLDKIVIHIE